MRRTVAVLFAVGWILVLMNDALAQWQGLCPNGRWVPSGPGYMCLENTPQQPTNIPQFNPNAYLQEQQTIYNNAVIREYESLGQKIISGQPLRQDIPLSSGLVMQKIYVPPPPTNYVDPFAAKAPVPVTSSTSTLPPSGNIWDKSQAVTLQPTQPAPLATVPGASNSNPSYQQSPSTFGCPQGQVQKTMQTSSGIQVYCSVL